MHGIRTSVPTFLALSASAFLIANLASCSIAPRGPQPPLVNVPYQWSQAPVVALSDSTLWNVRAAADSNVLDRRAVTWYYVGKRNPPALETLSFYDDETTETPAAIQVDAFFPDGSRWHSDAAGCARTRAGTAGILASNAFVRNVTLPRYPEGLVLRVETRQTVTRPAFRNLEPLRGGYPCLRRFASITYPAGYVPAAGVGGAEPLARHADTVSGASGTTVRATAEDLAPMQGPEHQTYPEEWCAALRFSVPPRGKRPWTWSELGDYYLGMIAGSLGYGPSVRRAADSLKGSDPDSLADRAFAFLQARVRYLADEERLNALIPRSPDFVIEKGYGDCKEMSNLLRALLQEKGVATGLALTHSPGAPQLLRDYPSLAGFNHMVLWRRLPDGAVRYYDPTMPAGPAAESYFPLLSQKALRLEPGASAPDTISPAPGYRNRAVTLQRLAPGGEGRWMLKGVIGLKGKAAFDLNQELLYRRPGRSEARAAVRAFLAEGFGIQAAAWDWSSPAADSVRIEYAMPADAMVVSLGGGGVRLDAPSLMGMGSARAVAEGDRRDPGFEQEDHWILPRGYKRMPVREFRNGPAEGKWSSSGSEVKRDFRCAGTVWKAGDRARQGYLEALTQFSLASVWQ